MAKVVPVSPSPNSRVEGIEFRFSLQQGLADRLEASAALADCRLRFPRGGERRRSKRGFRLCESPWTDGHAGASHSDISASISSASTGRTETETPFISSAVIRRAGPTTNSGAPAKGRFQHRLGEDRHFEVRRAAQIVDQKSERSRRRDEPAKSVRHQLRDSSGGREIDRLELQARREFRVPIPPAPRPVARALSGQELNRSSLRCRGSWPRPRHGRRWRPPSRDLPPIRRRYPAILWTKSVPAMPRGWAKSSSAMSSATMTISTFKSSRARALGGETKIEPVARVVLDDQQAPLLARHRQNRRVHCIDGRGSEDLSANRGRQSAPADEPRMRRLVPRASSRNERHLAPVPVGANDNLDIWKAIKPRQRPRRRGEKTVDRVGNDRVSLIHEMSHAVAAPPPYTIVWSSRGRFWRARDDLFDRCNQRSQDKRITGHGVALTRRRGRCVARMHQSRADRASSSPTSWPAASA